MGSFGTKFTTVLSIILFGFSSLFALGTTYYSQGSANFSVTSNWTTNADGTGSNPADFTDDDIFIIQNGHTITMDNVENYLESLTIQNGGTFNNSSNTVVFEIDGTGLIVQSGGTYTASTGTIEANGGRNTEIVITIPTSTSFYNIKTYGYLTFEDNSTNSTFTINGTLSFYQSRSLTLNNTAAIAYGTNGTLEYQYNKTVGVEWPSSGVPNVLLASGTATISDGNTYTVSNKLTRSGGAISVTSGTLAFGSTATLEYNPFPAADMTVSDEWPTSSGPANVTVNNSGYTITVSDAARTIPKTLNMVAGTLAMGSNTLTVLGSIASSDIAGSGTVTGSSINIGNGTDQLDQTISGSVTLDNLTVNKTGSNNNLTISGSPTITNDFTVTNGDVIANGTVTISSGALILDNASTFTVNSGALSVATLTLNSTSTFTTGGKTISGLTTLNAASGSTYEFNGTSAETTPTDATFGNLNMNNTAGLNIDGTVTVNGTLTFNQDATVNTDATNTLVISTTGSVSGSAAARYVKGPLRKQFSGTGSFTFAVGTSSHRPAVFEYTSGTFGGTSVIEIEHSTASFTSGTRPTGISAIDQSSHYIVKEVGTAPTNFQYNFTGNFENDNFTPETRNRILVQASSTPTWTVGTTDVATGINTTNNTVLATGLSELPTDSPFIVAFGSATTAVTWDGGGGDSNWSTAANWVGDAVPQTGDAVLLDNSALATDYSVTYDASVSQTSFSSIQINSDASHSITLTLEKSATIDLTATSDLIVVGSSDKLVYAGSDITMSSAAYDPSKTTLSGEVEYQTGSVYVDSYDGNLVINGATGTSGTGTVAVAGNLTKNSTTAFSTSQAVTVTGNYINTQGNVDFSGGLTLSGTTFTVSNGTINGTVEMAGSSAQTMEGGGSAYSIENLTVNNSNGLTLNNPVIVSGTLTLTSGLIHTDDTNLLTIGSSGSISGYSSTRYINGTLAYSGTGSKYFPIGNSGDYRPVELVNLAGTDPVVRFKMVKSSPGGTVDGTLDHISAVRYWLGTLTSGSISGCQVKLSWETNDGVDGSLDNIAVATSSSQSGTYTSAGNSGTSGNSSSGTVLSNSLTTMQYFTLGSISTDNSLPVELASFTASADFGKVVLDWTTASELDNLGFNIFRRLLAEEDAWEQVNSDMIEGQGNTSQETNYSFVDSKVIAGQTYVYKLQSVSLNGVLADEKTVEVSVPVPTEYALFNNYPNPFNPTTSIRFQMPETNKVQLVIYDSQGRIVKQLIKNKSMSRGEHVVTWDATDEIGNRVASGMYFYRFGAGSFVKMGKMILLK